MNYQNIDWNQAVQTKLADYEKAKTAPTYEKKEIDLTKYFTLMLPDKVNQGEKTVRLLPLSAENPMEFYAIVKFHNLKVGKKWVKLYDPAQDNEESPLNDVAKELYKAEGTTEEKAENKKLANTYRSRDFYVVRLIDRSLEHEGPKFWRFNKVNDGSGIMDKLVPIMNRLNEKTPGNGAIWRPDALGRDVVISLVRDMSKGFTKVSSIMVDDPTPLHADQAQADAWVNDITTWRDVYKKKPVEYLRIIAEGSEPIWSADEKKFVAKVEGESYETKMTEQKTKFNSPQNEATAPQEMGEEAVEVNVDDLPF